MEVKRTEQKFILNYKESLLLRRKLDAILPRDIHCTSSDGYDVRSLYFDTVTDKSCAEKEDARKDTDSRLWNRQQCHQIGKQKKAG